MNDSCFIFYGYARWRLLRYKLSPWIALLTAPFALIRASGDDRISQKIRWMKATISIDFASFYELVNDLLW